MIVTLRLTTPDLANPTFWLDSTWICEDFYVDGATLVMHGGYLTERIRIDRNGNLGQTFYPHGAKVDPQDHWLVLPPGSQLTLVRRDEQPPTRPTSSPDLSPWVKTAMGRD